MTTVFRSARRAIFVAALAVGASTTGALSQFQVDMAQDQIRKAIGELALSDLGVGEVANVSYPAVCLESGLLFVSTQQLLAESANDYGVNWRVRREPGNAVSVTLEVGKSAVDTTIESYLGNLAYNATSCDAFRLVGRGEVYAVVSFNGIERLSGLLK